MKEKNHLEMFEVRVLQLAINKNYLQIAEYPEVMMTKTSSLCTTIKVLLSFLARVCRLVMSL